MFALGMICAVVSGNLITIIIVVYLYDRWRREHGHSDDQKTTEGKA